MKRIDHAGLEKRMILTLRLRSDEGLHEDYDRFFRELVKEAKAIDRQESTSLWKDIEGGISDSDADEGHSKRKSKKRSRAPKDKRKSDSGATPKDKESTVEGRGKSKKQKPACLNPKCDRRHYLDKCPKTSDADRKRLLAEYHAKRKAHKKVSAARVASTTNSTLFTASMCSGKVETKVLADQGADVSVIPRILLKKVLEADTRVKLVSRKKVLKIKPVNVDGAPLHCREETCLDILLQIRHGTSLSLRNVPLVVSDEDTGMLVLARPVLEALGLNNTELLATACDRLGGVADAAVLLKQREEGAEVTARACAIDKGSRIDVESMYHSDGPHVDDTTNTQETYVDLGEDDPIEFEQTLRERVKDARREGLSAQGCKNLASLLDEYMSIFD